MGYTPDSQRITFLPRVGKLFSALCLQLQHVAHPLTALTGSGVPWLWTGEHEAAFLAIKTALASPPVLALPDFTKPFEVVSDASLHGTGAVLLQEGRPLAFTSKKFIAAERNYTTGEQELLSVITALKEWRCYLKGGSTL